MDKSKLKSLIKSILTESGWTGWGNITGYEKEELSNKMVDYLKYIKNIYSPQLFNSKKVIINKFIESLESTDPTESIRLFSKFTMEDTFSIFDFIDENNDAIKVLDFIHTNSTKIPKSKNVNKKEDFILKGIAKSEDGNSYDVKIFNLMDMKPKISIADYPPYTFDTLKSHTGNRLSLDKNLMIINFQEVLSKVSDYIEKYNNDNELLQEAPPVDVYQTIGDFEKGRSMQDPRDRKSITSDVTIKKVKDFFKNTTVDFDFYFVNLSGRRSFREFGKVSEKFLYEKYPNGLGITPDQLRDGKINDQNITVFFVGNVAAEKIPMTSWTIAHRLGHAMRRTTSFEYMTNWLESQFNEILKLYNKNVPPKWDMNTYEIDKFRCGLFNQIGTMKSARENKIKRQFEFYYELFAQYLKDGEIKLNRLSSSIFAKYAAYGRKENMYTRDVEEVNSILTGVERDFEYYAESVLSSEIGNIFIM